MPDSRAIDGLLIIHTIVNAQIRTYIHTYMHCMHTPSTLKATPSLPWSFLLSTKLMKITPERMVMEISIYQS